MPYFPDEVKTESVSKYISPSKLSEGSTKFRFLEEPIFFFETWQTDSSGNRTPKRFAMTEEIPVSEVGPDGIKQVMASKVYNYSARAIQIMSITQVTILGPMKEATKNPKYGDLPGYDVYIKKTGIGKQSRYSFDKDPKEAMSEEVKKASGYVVVNLDAMLINADPFLKDSTPDKVDKASISKTNDKSEDEVPF